VEDASITARIETLFMLNEHLSAFDINTSTRDGVVTLTGGVNDNVQRGLAADLATSVPGVQKVVNNIVLQPDSENDKDRRIWKQAVEDRTISASVRGRLVYHGEFKGLKIGIETVNNEVTLYGVVRSEEQRNKLARIAADTRGVAKVYNNLSVAPATSSGSPPADAGAKVSDEVLEKRIERTILFNRHLSIVDLDVEVNNGVTVLSGNVDTEEQRKLAEEITRSLGGVGEIRNEIRLFDNVTVFDDSQPANPAPPVLQDIDPDDEPRPVVQTMPLK